MPDSVTRTSASPSGAGTGASVSAMPSSTRRARTGHVYHRSAVERLGPYQLVRQIAMGGMAEVWLAKTVGIAGFEKYVALKMIHPNYNEDEEFIGMLVDEAKLAVQLT